MKTKYIFYVQLVVFLFLISSCTNNKEVVTDELQVLEASDETMEASYNLLNYTPNVYHDFFKESDNAVGVSSLKPDPLRNYSVIQTNVLNEGVLKNQFSINNTSIASKSGFAKVPENNAENLFGRVVTFSVKSESGKTFKNGSTSKDVEMYIPKQLQITNPEVATEDELMPFCFSEDFVLEWNADLDNKEGLVVVAEYLGVSALPSKSIKRQIVNTDFIEEDNGRAILDNDIWKEIPDTGIVHLTLLRGNVKIEEIDSENYKFFAEARAVLPIVLIKDINSIE